MPSMAALSATAASRSAILLIPAAALLIQRDHLGRAVVLRCVPLGDTGGLRMLRLGGLRLVPLLASNRGLLVPWCWLRSCGGIWRPERLGARRSSYGSRRRAMRRLAGNDHHAAAQHDRNSHSGQSRSHAALCSWSIPVHGYDKTRAGTDSTEKPERRSGAPASSSQANCSMPGESPQLRCLAADNHHF